MKRKGFTLIELIAAMAIISISMAGISAAFMSSMNISKSGDVKLNTTSFSKGIVQYYIDDEGLKLKSIYDSSNKTGNTVSFYIYYDDMEGLIDNLGNIKTVAGGAEDDFDICKAGASDSRYGAFISISKIDENILTKYDTYRLYTDVWDMDYGRSNSSKIYDFNISK